MIELIPTDNMMLIRCIITQTEIWSDCTEDDIDQDSFMPSTGPLSCWLLCKINDEIIGAIYVHNENSRSLNMHPHLVSKCRRHSRDLINEFFKWFLELPAEFCKVNVSIPSCRKIVYNLAKKVGFVDEGVNRASYLKGGVMHDQYLLGLTRKEIEELNL